MNLAKLRSLVTVARHGSFRAASRSMAVTQSAVSKAVAEVEQDLGFAVFERHARGVVLTEAGQDFVDQAARLFADFDLLIENVERKRAERQKVLRYAVAPPSLTGLLNRPLLRLVQKDPTLRLHCEEVGISRGLELLRRGDIDVFVGPTQGIADLPELATHIIQPAFEAQLCGRNDHPLVGKRRPKVAEVASYPLILTTAADLFIREFLGGKQEEHERSASWHVLDNQQLVMNIAATSDALVVLSKDYASSSAVRRRLQPLDLPLAPISIGCTFRRRWLVSAAMRRFMDALAEDPPA